jgi:hypothetical protein
MAGYTSQYPRYNQQEFFSDRGPLSDYLAANTIVAAESYAAGRNWTRVIRDVIAVALLKNRDDRFLLSRIVPMSLPTYDRQYKDVASAPLMRYVY